MMYIISNMFAGKTAVIMKVKKNYVYTDVFYVVCPVNLISNRIIKFAELSVIIK